MSLADYRLSISENELLRKSWIDIRWYLTNDEIVQIQQLSSDFKNQQFVALPKTIFKILLKYISHTNTYEECKKIFSGIENYYPKSYYKSAVEEIVRNELAESKPEKELWEILKEEEDNRKRNRNERRRIVDNVIAESYQKYYEEYKNQYGYTYQSPNSSAQNNYGYFLNKIIENLKEYDVIFDLKHPWSKSYEKYSNEIYKKKFGEPIVPSLKAPNVSKIIKDLLQNDLLDKYYELQIKYELKRFFLLGGITREMLLLDYVKYYGYEFLKSHLSELRWEEFKRGIECYRDGIYGIQNGWSYKYFTKYQENDVFLIGIIKEDPIYRQNEEIKKNPTLIEFYKKNGHNFEIERVKELFHSPVISVSIDDFQAHEFIKEKEMYYDYINSFAGPENEIRKLFGFKEIGEGWVSETKLFYLIKERFKEYRVIQHGKPKWLGKQHLDIFIPDLNIGIEYQGKQHSIPLAIFGGEENFQENVKRDKRKKLLCEENQCKLFEVFPEDDFFEFIEQLQAYIEKLG